MQQATQYVKIDLTNFIIPKDSRGQYCWEKNLDLLVGSTFTVETGSNTFTIVITDFTFENNKRNIRLFTKCLETGFVTSIQHNRLVNDCNKNDCKSLAFKLIGIQESKAKTKKEHVDFPLIHGEQQNCSGIYWLVSKYSCYCGKVNRLLIERVFEETTVVDSPYKETWNIIQEGGSYSLVCRIPDFPLDTPVADCNKQTQEIETLFITLQQSLGIETVNRKQILKAKGSKCKEKVIIDHIGSLPYVNIEVDWKLLAVAGLSIPRGFGSNLIRSSSYGIPRDFYNKFNSLLDKYRDTSNLTDTSRFDYCMLFYLLLPHKTQKQIDYWFDLLAKRLNKTDTRREVCLIQPLEQEIADCQRELNNPHSRYDKEYMQRQLDLLLDIQENPNKYKVTRHYY